MHLYEDAFLPEIIDPETGAVLPPGSEGELVITTLAKEAFPMIRYRTGDITSLDYSPLSLRQNFSAHEKNSAAFRRHAHHSRCKCLSFTD